MAELTAARSNALPYPVYGVPWVQPVIILDADGDFVSGAAGLDSEVSKNFDTPADCTNESTEVASSGRYYLILTGSEMTADVVDATIKTSTVGAKSTPISLFPRKLVSLRSGTAAGGAAGSITLDSGASAIDDAYNGCLVVGTLDGNVEARIISDYNGSTKVATVVPDWVTTPDSDDTFVIYLPEGMQMPQADLRAWLGVAPLALASQLVQVSVGAMQSAVLTATAIASDAITAAKIAADAITSAKVADGFLTAAKFASGAFDAVWSVATRVLTAATNLTTALATPTNITAGTITTATNLTNLPSIPANWITAAGITDGAFTAAKFASGAFDAVWTVAARTLTSFGTLASDVWAVATRVLTAGTNIVLAKGTGVTGFNDLSAAQVNAEADTALSDVGLTTTVTGRVDVAVSTRLAASSYTAPDNTGIAVAASAAASAATDTQTLLGRLSALRASYLDNLSAGAVALEASLQGLITTIGASAAGVATAVWSAGTRILTAGTNIVLAKGTGVTGFNDLSAAQVNTEADTALSDVGLTSTVTGRVDAAISTRATPAQVASELATYDAPTKAELDAAIATLSSAIAALNNLSAAQVTAAVPTAVQNADAYLKRDMSAVTGEAARSPLNAHRFSRNRWEIVGGVLTVYKEDDTTIAWTAPVTQTAGDPVSAIDPA
jgi:hypothetical protein